MITRKIGKILRGNINPFQIYSATILGSLIAFLPPISNAPGLYFLYLTLLLILNANLFVAAFFGVLAKILYFITLPMLLTLGSFLVSGPLEELIVKLVNAPVFAWFGFEYYTTSAGVLVASLLGLIGGYILISGIRSFRKKMAEAETNSEAYQKLSSNFLFKSLAWVLFGGLKGKKSWKELTGKQKALPVRPIGLVLVVLLAGFLFIIGKFFDQTIITSYLRDSLTKFNGATVDIESVEIALGDNKIQLKQLAFANPEDLLKNRFETPLVTIDLSGLDLLAKRIVMDQVVIESPLSGSSRKIPGVKYQELKQEKAVDLKENEYSVLDWIKGDKWRSRLETAQRVYDKVSPYMADGDNDTEESPEVVRKESFRDRLAREAELLGYANVMAKNVIRESPRLVITDLQAPGLKVVDDNAEIFDVSGKHLSSNPRLMKVAGELSAIGKSKPFLLKVTFPYEEKTALGFSIERKELPVQSLTREMKNPEKFPLQEGMIEFSGTGSIDGGFLNLPLSVIVRNTKVNAFGNTTPVSKLPVEVVLSGTLSNPKIKIPKDALTGVIKDIGKEKIKSEIEEKIGDKVGDKIKGLFGG